MNDAELTPNQENELGDVEYPNMDMPWDEIDIPQEDMSAETGHDISVNTSWWQQLWKLVKNAKNIVDEIKTLLMLATKLVASLKLIIGLVVLACLVVLCLRLFGGGKTLPTPTNGSSTAVLGPVDTNAKVYTEQNQEAGQNKEEALPQSIEPPRPTIMTNADINQTSSYKVAQGETEVKRETSREASLPMDTEIFVRIPKTISTDTHNVNDPWEGVLAQDVTADNAVVWTIGTKVTGLVRQSTPTGRITKGKGAFVLSLTNIGGQAVDGGDYEAKVTSPGKKIITKIGVNVIKILPNKKNKGSEAIEEVADTAVDTLSADNAIKISLNSTISFKLQTNVNVVIKEGR